MLRIQGYSRRSACLAAQYSGAARVLAAGLCGFSLMLAGCERPPSAQSGSPAAATNTNSAAQAQPPAPSGEKAPAASPRPDAAPKPAGSQPSEEDIAAVRRALQSSNAPGAMAATGRDPHAASQPAGGSPHGGRMPGGGIFIEAPAAWKTVAPAPGSPRIAHFEVPLASGDSGTAEVVVTHFPGQGAVGGVDMNIDRWVSFFKNKEGGPLDAAAIKRETFAHDQLTVHMVEANGFYTSPQMAGGTGKTTESEYMLLGAIVEGSGGPWFFRGTGPKATMTAARADFVKLLRELKIKN
ncbi:hypothetical protein RAS1_39330 [Phycisphaerae bacterium RAS1]|nr:hypothetical protein RAS1_39330 [Phycisphaerae bacterium RAS1]